MQVGAITNESDLDSKHTKNEAVQQTGRGAYRTPALLSFADHMDRLVAADGAPSSPNDRNADSR